METLQSLQQFDPAVMISAVLVLSSMTAMLVQALGFAGNLSRSDEWNAKAAAAVKWSNTVAKLAGTRATVFKFPARRAALRNAA
jgi:hypothetical protein